MLKMAYNRVLLVLTVLYVVAINGIPIPGRGHHHVHHRIHVPQRIKTVYHTKIIKVPEHHHHFHEKEKIIIQKEKPKEEHHEFPSHLLENEEHDWQSLESSHVYKKKRYVPSSQAPKFKNRPKVTKKRIVRPHYNKHEKEE